MSFRENLRRGRSHLITVAVLLIAGAAIVRIEDRELDRTISRDTAQAPTPGLPAAGEPAPAGSHRRVRTPTQPAWSTSGD